MKRPSLDPTLATAAALGAIAGLRSLAAPALVAHEVARSPAPEGALERLLGSVAFSRILDLLSGGEMLADKSARIPDRVDPGPLLARVALGSLSAAAFASRRGYSIPRASGIAAGTALVTSFVSFRLRQGAAEEFGIPDSLLGMAEDAIVLVATRSLSAALEREE